MYGGSKRVKVKTSLNFAKAPETLTGDCGDDDVLNCDVAF